MLEMQYTLTPVEAKKEEVAVGQLPQIQTSQDRQYNKATKITNLEFSNPLYRVILNGEINNLSDDEMPSGSIAVKVENVSNLVDYVKLAINQMIDPTKKANANAAPDVSATTASTQPAVANDPAQQAAATPNAPASAASPVATPDAATTVASAPATTPAVTAPATEDPYTNFLKRVGTNLSAVAQEIAAKNQVSKDNVAQFDIRREKNLDFLINETSLREILGKM